MESQHVVFMEKVFLFGCFFVLFTQGMVTEVRPLYKGACIWRWPLTQI